MSFEMAIQNMVEKDVCPKDGSRLVVLEGVSICFDLESGISLSGRGKLATLTGLATQLVSSDVLFRRGCRRKLILRRLGVETTRVPFQV